MSRRWITSVLAVVILTSPVFAQFGDKPAPLLLFGQKDHKQFLGCLNCGPYDSGSVCNKFGEYGSKFSATSIWNQFGEYGSRLSGLSPWNLFAIDPPVIVDRDGGFYGYFTANTFHDKRTQIKFFLVFLNNVDKVNDDLDNARDLFCE